MTINTKEKRLLNNTIALYALQASNLLLPLITMKYLANVLQADVYGYIIFSTAVMAYVSMVIDFGFTMSGTKDISLHREDSRYVAKVLYNIIGIKFLLAFICGIGLLLAIILIDQVREFSALYILTFFWSVANSFQPDFLFRGLENMRIITIRTVLTKLFCTVFIFILVQNRSDYILVPLLNLIGAILSVVISWVFIINTLKIKFSMPDFKTMLAMFIDSAQFFLSRVAFTVYTSSNTVLLGILSSITQASYYGSSNRLIVAVQSGFTPISESLYPYMIKEKNIRLIKKILLLGSPIVALGCMLIFFFAELIIKIFLSESFLPAADILRAMAPLPLIIFISVIIGYPTLGALGRTDKANISVMYGSLFHIAGLLILALFDKISGLSVVIQTICTETLILSLRFYYLYRYKDEKNS